MKDSTKHMILFAAIAFAAVFLAGYMAGERRCRGEVQVQTDTLVVVDTVMVREPEFVEREVVRTELVAVTDTVRVRDTLYVEVPVESRHYSDSLYEAWVSGYRASLDSIRVYPVTKYVTTERTVSVKDRRRWGIGVQAGYGIPLNGDYRPAPYIGVGVSYSMIMF